MWNREFLYKNSNERTSEVGKCFQQDVYVLISLMFLGVFWLDFQKSSFSGWCSGAAYQLGRITSSSKTKFTSKVILYTHLCDKFYKSVMWYVVTEEYKSRSVRIEDCWVCTIPHNNLVFSKITLFFKMIHPHC